MATYKDVQRDIKDHEGIVVKTCWIAHVKTLNGLPTREASNRKAADKRVNPCPPERQVTIERSFRRMGWL